MLVIYAGGFIAALLLGEPMLSPLKNTQSVHLATAVWCVSFTTYLKFLSNYTDFIDP